jgi:hypothetical protein
MVVEGCPPEYDPRKNCIACELVFENFEELKEHIQKAHPDLVAHWKSILCSWDVEC